MKCVLVDTCHSRGKKMVYDYHIRVNKKIFVVEAWTRKEAIKKILKERQSIKRKDIDSVKRGRFVL